MKKVKITLVKSSYGRMPAQRATLNALGLRKIHSTVVKTDTQSLQGMINRVKHLIKVEGVA